MTTDEIIFKCSAGMGEPVTGVALSAGDDFSARYDLDRIRGVFSRPSHKLYGQSYVGKILVLNTAKGGVATAWMLLDMVSRGLAPAALISEQRESDHGTRCCICGPSSDARI